MDEVFAERPRAALVRALRRRRCLVRSGQHARRGRRGPTGPRRAAPSWRCPRAPALRPTGRRPAPSTSAGIPTHAAGRRARDRGAHRRGAGRAGDVGHVPSTGRRSGGDWCRGGLRELRRGEPEGRALLRCLRQRPPGDHRRCGERPVPEGRHGRLRGPRRLDQRAGGCRPRGGAALGRPLLRRAPTGGRGPWRPGGQVHRRRGDGRVRHPRGARGRRPPCARDRRPRCTRRWPASGVAPVHRSA